MDGRERGEREVNLLNVNVSASLFANDSLLRLQFLISFSMATTAAAAADRIRFNNAFKMFHWSI